MLLEWFNSIKFLVTHVTYQTSANFFQFSFVLAIVKSHNTMFTIKTIRVYRSKSDNMALWSVLKFRDNISIVSRDTSYRDDYFNLTFPWSLIVKLNLFLQSAQMKNALTLKAPSWLWQSITDVPIGFWESQYIQRKTIDLTRSIIFCFISLWNSYSTAPTE